MKFSELMKGTKSLANTALLTCKKHSPEILEVAGMIGVVTAGVLACKATTKIETITEPHKEIMNRINTQEISEEYTEKDKQKDTVIVYSQTAVKLASLYAPSIVLGLVSMACLHKSNDILRKRNASLAAAYVVIDTAFKEYRKRVKDRFGEEVEKQIRLNLKEEKIEKEVIDENGKKKKVKETVTVSEGKESGYMRYILRTNPNFDSDSSFMQLFVNAQQSWANDLLRAKGHVTLNEVYRLLGLSDTKAGMVVGWIYDRKNPKGDNYIQFEVTRTMIPSDIDGELEVAYAIDFNVDGNIYQDL